MMRIETMRLIIEDSGEANLAIPLAAANRWGCGDGTLCLWRVSTNFVFRFEQKGLPRALRLAHVGERNREKIQAELDFLFHVTAQGVRAALPRPSTAGQLIEEIETEKGSFLAVVFDWLNEENFEAEDMDEHRMREWGRALGQLHAAAATFPHQTARRSWKDEVNAALDRIPKSKRNAHRQLSELRRRIDSLPVTSGDFGLIHGDFELDNLFWDGAHFHAIDFDDAVYQWYAADVAFALGDVFEFPSPQREQYVGWFLEGYRAAKHFDDLWLDAMPRFMALAKLLTYARLLRSYAGSNPNQDPPWISNMRQRHQEWIDRIESVFASM